MVLLGGKTNVAETRDGTMDLVSILTCPLYTSPRDLSSHYLSTDHLSGLKTRW